MWVERFWAYVFGYLVITVQGQRPEHLINLAMTRNIRLWEIVRVDDQTLVARISVRSFRSLRHLARRARCRIRIRKKRGLPFLLFRLRGRQMLVCGVLVFYFLLWTLSSFIWLVEVEGARKVPQAKILKVAAAAGLRPGSLKSGFTGEEVARRILESVPGLSYVEVEVRGTKAQIRVVESIPPEKTGQPCHLVARRSGIIKEILVLSGTPEVKEGDLVQKGQVLISGIVEEEPSEREGDLVPLERPRYVEAQGIVRARVWYRACGEAARREVVEKKTGRVTRIYCIRWQQKEIIIKGPCKIPYSFYHLKVKRRNFPEWRNITLPVEFVTIEAEEIRKEQIQRSFDEALELAKKGARENLQELIPAEASVVRQQVRVLKESRENLVRVVLTAEVVEDIGEKKPFELPQ